ncbi:MAG: hypothetical protein JF616_17890 [Fibrobacteres bacterium]|nr:hypothetical protein [Fibrobacterota bacterium]
MNLRIAFLPLSIAALLTTATWADDPASTPAQQPAKPAATESHAATAKQDYDAIFSDILKSLPQDKRALVDSAHGAKGNAAVPAPGPVDPDAVRKAGEAKRSQALQALPPEVKARVDKAISDLDNRRKQKQAEFKELEK